MNPCPSLQFHTIPEYIFRAGVRHDSVAIGGVDGRTLTYGGLREKVRMIVGGLNSQGFSRNDRIAIVHQDGLEMAACLVAILSGFTAIPLNPSLRTAEFSGYFSTIGAKALVTEPGDEAPLKGVAKDLGIETVEVRSLKGSGEEAFTIVCPSGHPPEEPKFAGPEDKSFILQSSGTTSKPKWIPITHSNACWNIQNRINYLSETADDRGLIIAPLFHAQGLFSLLSCICAGGMAVCAPGFSPVKFYSWLDSVRPTWYTSGPAVHQLVLDTANEKMDVISRSCLRQIRTGSGSTPQSTLQELGRLFRTSLIESYASTEGGAIGWNPDPAHSTGFRLCYPYGPEVAIIGDDAQALPQDKLGEIVVRGPAVFKGYINDPLATSAAFVDDWFRTGDRGYLDGEKFLHLAGRIKEEINMGGEKVAPQEVERALLEHPAIAEAVAFPVPHQTLGEVVAAAVVLKRDQCVSENDLRAFLFSHLVYFKVPTRIVFVDSLPKGPVGKVSRLDMAKALDLL